MEKKKYLWERANGSIEVLFLEWIRFESSCPCKAVNVGNELIVL